MRAKKAEFLPESERAHLMPKRGNGGQRGLIWCLRRLIWGPRGVDKGLRRLIWDLRGLSYDLRGQHPHEKTDLGPLPQDSEPGPKLGGGRGNSGRRNRMPCVQDVQCHWLSEIGSSFKEIFLVAPFEKKSKIDTFSSYSVFKIYWAIGKCFSMIYLYSWAWWNDLALWCYFATSWCHKQVLLRCKSSKLYSKSTKPICTQDWCSLGHPSLIFLN